MSKAILKNCSISAKNISMCSRVRRKGVHEEEAGMRIAQAVMDDQYGTCTTEGGQGQYQEQGRQVSSMSMKNIFTK